MDLEDMINKVPADLDPKVGEMLISAPMMSDPNFCRTAVLVIDREREGAHLGLVLNRELDLPVSSILADWPNADKINLFHGGPVELDRLFMLHRLGDKVSGSFEIMPGLYTGGNTDDLRKCFDEESDLHTKIRFFLGYAGWAKGQLTSEILQNSWAVNTNPDSASLFAGSGFSYWDREVRSLGHEYRSWLNLPIHPSLN